MPNSRQGPRQSVASVGRDRLVLSGMGLGRDAGGPVARGYSSSMETGMGGQPLVRWQLDRVRIRPQCISLPLALSFVSRRLKTSYRRLGFSSEEAAHLCLSPSPPAHPHVSADPGSSASKGTEGRGRVRSEQDVPREEQAAEKKPLVESVGRKETECRKRRRESD
eukprot:3163674-Rhodomonas_salina.1